MNLDKESIIIHYENSIIWVKSLNTLSEEQWRTPIDKDKWTVAEVIGHLIPWDDFVLNQRIPYLIKEIQLPQTLDVAQINYQASIDSKNRTKEETIREFIIGRRNLLSSLRDFSGLLWEKDFYIGKSKLSLCRYFAGLVEHDEHHFRQIQKVL